MVAPILDHLSPLLSAIMIGRSCKPLLGLIMALLWQAAAAQNGGSGNAYSYVHAQEDRVSLTFLYPSTQQLWVAHGYLMIISFVFLIPLAIAASMLRFMLPGACWFTLHTFLSWLAFL